MPSTRDPNPTDARPASRRTRHRPRRRRRPVAPTLAILGGILAASLAAVVVTAVVFAGQAQEARAHLVAAQDAADGIAEALRAQDVDRVHALAGEASAHVRSAEEIVDGPLWGALAALPLIGPDVDAVRTMTHAAATLDERALPGGLRIMADLSTGSLAADGAGIDLAPLRDAMTELPGISAAVADADEALSSIDRGVLLPEVADAADGFCRLIGDLRPALAGAEHAVPVLLKMAGGEGSRSYLVAFQNTAEARATGGNPSALAVLDLDDGRATLDTQADSTTFYTAGLVGHDVIDVDAEVRALYESDTWQFPQNYTRTPDFTLTARLFDGLWTKATGRRVDGILSLDPIALAKVLAVTGPVTLDDGEVISADNAVPLLLKDSYARYGDDGTAADAFFARVVQRVFAVLARGDWAPVPMLEALSQGVAEHRVLAWMRDADAQATVADAGMAGTFAPDDVGVFVNDSSHSKLEYYLSSAIEVTCDRDARTVRTSIALTSTAPPDGLPGYVQGHRNPSLGLPGSTMLLDVLGFAPAGGHVESVDPASGDLRRGDRAGADGGRDARSITVELGAGQTKTVTFTASYDPEIGVGAVRFTPGIGATPVSVADSCR